LLFKNTPWDKIRKFVEQEKEACFPEAGVDAMASRLASSVNKTLEAHCPRAKPSPYMKRRRNEYLTALRKSYTYWRNRACAMRRQGREDAELRNTAIRVKRLFHRTIREEYWTATAEPTRPSKGRRRGSRRTAAPNDALPYPTIDYKASCLLTRLGQCTAG